MKRMKHIQLALYLPFILAISSCKNDKPVSSSGRGGINIANTSVNYYHSDIFSKNKEQEIILAVWDNIPIFDKFQSNSGIGESSNCIFSNLSKSNGNLKFQCIGFLDRKSGKGTVNINGKKFDISKGRLFLINTYVKPLKIIQINEPLGNLFTVAATCQNLAKKNKEVAAFLALKKEEKTSDEEGLSDSTTAPANDQ